MPGKIFTAGLLSADAAAVGMEIAPDNKGESNNVENVKREVREEAQTTAGE